jgi:hypothetical protein
MVSRLVIGVLRLLDWKASRGSAAELPAFSHLFIVAAKGNA